MMKLFFARNASNYLRNSLIGVLSACFAVSYVSAQVEIVEAGVAVNSTSRATSNASSSRGAESDDIVINLYLQLEALQQEVQTLRGVVEEQGYQLRRMQTESRDRYLDIDSRLSGLSNQSLAPTSEFTPARNSLDNTQASVSTSTFNNTSIVASQEPSRPVRGVTSNTPLVANAMTLTIPQNEQELYRTAFNLLIEESKYEDSISLFQQYIEVYSEGRYLVNSYYWQGEALILVERYNQAKEVFMLIINEHPLDSKAPGALLKLVVADIQLGDINKAIQSLLDLKNRYPDSLTEISAAESYLREARN